MNSRQFVYQILSNFDRHPGNLERMIENGLKDARIDHRDRRFVFEMVYGIVRRKMTLDYAIDNFLTDNFHLKNRDLRRVLQIGLYQLFYMDRVPDHAAVNETVNLAKNDPKMAGLAGVVNGVLRTVINNKRQVPSLGKQTELADRLSIEFSHPKWLLERWLTNFGLAKTKQLLTFNNEKPPIYLRRKIRDMSRPQFESDVRTICEAATGYLNLYYKLKKNLLPENIRLLQQGIATVQAPSSGWVVALLEVKKGDHLLDVCSAPGGKTTLMAELADNGTVCASEMKMPRLMNVIETAERMNLLNIYPLLCDGEFPPFAGTFDKVLIDAPCSATGVMHRHPEARWLRTMEDIEKLSGIQKRLLKGSSNLVGKNGIIVYSTCSLEPEENEKQIEEFLKENHSFVLERCPDTIPQNYVSDEGYLRITPYEHGMDGMFGALLKRID